MSKRKVAAKKVVRKAAKKKPAPKAKAKAKAKVAAVQAVKPRGRLVIIDKKIKPATKRTIKKIAKALAKPEIAKLAQEAGKGGPVTELVKALDDALPGIKVVEGKLPTLIGTFRRVELKVAMAKVCAIVERKNTIPIVAGVLAYPARDDDYRLDLIGNDLDMGITTPVRSSVIVSPQPFVVNAHALRNLIDKTMRSEMVELHAREGGGVVLKGDGMTAELGPAGIVSDYPMPVHPAQPGRITMERGALLNAIKRVRPAVSDEETRYYLNGIYFHPDIAGGRFRLVATDGHRLYRHMLPAGWTDDEIERLNGGAIIPRKFVDKLATIFTSSATLAMAPMDAPAVETPKQQEARAIYDAMVAEYGQPNAKHVMPPPEKSTTLHRVSFYDGETVATTKIIDGTFPEYERVIPKIETLTTHFCVPGGMFLAAVDSIPANGNKTQAIKLSLKRKGEGKVTDGFNIIISAVNQETDSKVEVTLDGTGSVLGPGLKLGFEIGFNRRYVVETIKAMMRGKDDIIVIKSADQASPSIVTADTHDDLDAILMPMRV